MLNRLLLGTVILALTALATPADALSRCMPGQSPATMTVGVAGQDMYFVNDACHGDCLLSTYVYAESNGIPGLQRLDPGRDDTCGGAYPPDTDII